MRELEAYKHGKIKMFYYGSQIVTSLLRTSFFVNRINVIYFDGFVE